MVVHLILNYVVVDFFLQFKKKWIGKKSSGAYFLYGRFFWKPFIVLILIAALFLTLIYREIDRSR